MIKTRTRFEAHAINAKLIAAQRQLTGEPSRYYSRNLTYRLQGLREEPVIDTVVAESVTGCLHLHCEQVRRVKAGSNREEPLQTAQQQSRTHQQHQRQRHLRHYKR